MKKKYNKNTHEKELLIRFNKQKLQTASNNI